MNRQHQALQDIKEVMKRVKITFEVKQGLTLIIKDSIMIHDLEILKRSIKNLSYKHVEELIKILEV